MTVGLLQSPFDDADAAGGKALNRHRSDKAHQSANGNIPFSMTPGIRSRKPRRLYRVTRASNHRHAQSHRQDLLRLKRTIPARKSFARYFHPTLHGYTSTRRRLSGIQLTFMKSIEPALRHQPPIRRAQRGRTRSRLRQLRSADLISWKQGPR